jgi:predicted lipid-binding transport protein (Tim44 family)
MKALVTPEHSFAQSSLEQSSLNQAEDSPAEINMSQIRVGGGVIGLIFAAGTAYIFFVGVPAVRWFLAGAGVVGVLISAALRVFHQYRPSRPATSILN